MSSLQPADHDALVREVLDELAGAEREAIDRWGELDPGERRLVERLDLEVLASLARALPVERPLAGGRVELLARVATSAARSDRDARRPRAAEPRWLLPLAAALAAAAVGLAGLLGIRLHGQGEALAALEAEVEQMREQASQLAARERKGREQLELVGAPGVEVCPLRPRQPSPIGGEPSGVLFVAADHQHWYLALHGLVPSPAGHVYQVWFVAPEGAVSAGILRHEVGVPFELSSPTMPPGTSAVRVTLEPLGGAAAPNGPEILFGDQPIQIHRL